MLYETIAVKSTMSLAQYQVYFCEHTNK